jgi:cytochrome c-type biogenesis protein
MSLNALLTHSLQTQAFLVVPLAAFLGGVFSSLLPCSIGMLPIMVAYMGGSRANGSRIAFGQAIGFVGGMCLSLTVLGLLAVLAGISLGTALGFWGYFLLGVLAVVMGLQLLGWLHLPALPGLKKLPDWAFGNLWSPVILGALFGLSATPCSTPFLTVLLGYMAQTKNLVLGALGLFSYALGQSVLLLLAGWGAGILKQRARLNQVGQVMNTMSGWILIGLGVYWLYQGFVLR